MARVAIIYSAAIFRERRLTESVSHFFLFQLKSIKNYKFRGTPLALLVWQGSPGFLVSIRTCILSRWAPIPNTFSTCPHICDIQPALDVTRNYCLGLIKPLKPSIWSDGLENPLTSPKTRLNFLSHSTTSSTFLHFDLESLMNVPLYHPWRSYYLFLNYPSWQRISKKFPSSLSFGNIKTTNYKCKTPLNIRFPGYWDKPRYIKKMLESRPEDALVKLVKLLKLVQLWRQYLLYWLY